MVTEGGGVAPEPRPATDGGDVVVGAVVVVLLLLLVVIGLHARLPFPRFSSHSRGFDAAVVGGLEVVAVALLVVLRMRTSHVARVRRTARASGRSPGTPWAVPDRLRNALGYVLGAGAAVLAVLLVLLLEHVHLSLHTSKSASGTRPPPRHSHPRPGSTVSGPNLHLPVFSALYVLLAAILIALIVMLVLRERQRRARRPVAAQATFAEEDLGAWHDTLVGGRRALLEVDDARAAIIACYVAMAARLSRAGTERSLADTPDEFLRRVAGVLTFSAEPARRLTDLFYEARFSSHPMGDDERVAARAALDELVADLSSRRRADAPDGDALAVGSI